jgi:hypothetical protein
MFSSIGKIIWFIGLCKESLHVSSTCLHQSWLSSTQPVVNRTPWRTQLALFGKSSHRGPI